MLDKLTFIFFHGFNKMQYENSVFLIHVDAIEISYREPWTRHHSGGTGTGFCITIGPEKYILTCAHVVENARRIEFIGTEHEAKVLFSSAVLDLAILNCPIKGAQALHLGEVKREDDIDIVGFPLGYRNISLAHGHVNRLVQLNKNNVHSLVYQTDISATPGNSGSPILNRHGEYVGVFHMVMKQHRNFQMFIPFFSIKYFLNCFLGGIMDFSMPTFKWQIIDKYMSWKGQLLITHKPADVEERLVVNTIEGIRIYQDGMIKLKDFLKYHGWSHSGEELISFHYLVSFINKSTILMGDKEFPLTKKCIEPGPPRYIIHGDFMFIPADYGLEHEIGMKFARTAADEPFAYIAYCDVHAYVGHLLDVSYDSLAGLLKDSSDQPIRIPLRNSHWFIQLNPEKGRSRLHKFFT